MPSDARRGKESGVEVDLELVQVITVEAETQVRIDDYLTREGAGLSEQAMSQENVEIVREHSTHSRAATETPGGSCVIRTWKSPRSATGRRPTSRGREAVWDFLVAADEPWEPGPYEMVEVIDADDKVMARQRRNLRGKSSGVEVEYDYWVVVTFRNAKAVRAEWFDARSEALQAAGLSE